MSVETPHLEWSGLDRLAAFLSYSPVGLLPYLGVEFSDFGGGILLHARHLPGKSRDHTFLGLTLPAGDLCRMHVVLAGQLSQGKLAGRALSATWVLNTAETSVAGTSKTVLLV